MMTILLNFLQTIRQEQRNQKPGLQLQLKTRQFSDLSHPVFAANKRRY